MDARISCFVFCDFVRRAVVAKHVSWRLARGFLLCSFVKHMSCDVKHFEIVVCFFPVCSGSSFPCLDIYVFAFEEADISNR